MKVAITAEGPDAGSAVAQRFGRAPWFVVADDAGAMRAVKNTQNVEAVQGAGVQAAQTLAAEGVAVLITGHCGPKAYQVLRAADIRVFAGARGTVAEALEQFRRGALSEARGPDVQSHWV